MCVCAPGLLKTSNQPNCTNKSIPGSSIGDRGVTPSRVRVRVHVRVRVRVCLRVRARERVRVRLSRTCA